MLVIVVLGGTYVEQHLSRLRFNDTATIRFKRKRALASKPLFASFNTPGDQRLSPGDERPSKALGV